MNIQNYIKKQHKKQAKPLKDVITSDALHSIDIRDKEIMVTSARRLIDDLNAMELLVSSLELKPEQLVRLKQFVSTNKARARKLIWGLTVSRIKDDADESNTTTEEELREHNRVMKMRDDEDDGI